MANYKYYRQGFRKRQVTTLVVNNSATLVDTEMVTPVLKVGHSYKIYVYGCFNGGSTPDVDVKWDLGTMVAAFSFYANESFASTVALTTEILLPQAGANVSDVLVAHIYDVTTAGSIKLQFAQNVANVSDTKFLKGSFMEVIQF